MDGVELDAHGALPLLDAEEEQNGIVQHHDQLQQGELESACGNLTSDPVVVTDLVSVEEISVRGFKSFRLKTKIGPLTSFSCIVGPNGSGKSVIGEALAFVLGGSAKTMRAKGLSGLLNEDLRKHDSKSFAKVSVTLRVSTNLRVKISRTVAGSTSNYFWKCHGVKRPLSFTELKKELEMLHIPADISESILK